MESSKPEEKRESYYAELVRRGRRAVREARENLSPQEIEIIGKMTPQKRLEVSFGLYDTAWKLKEAYLRQTHPKWSEQQVQISLREAFLYGES